MNWIQKIWPRRAKAKSKQGLGGALVSAYGQDLQYPDELINRANKRAVKGDLNGAIADFDAAIELNPAKATTFYNRAYLNNLAGNHEQALRDCSEAIALLPNYDEAFYQRGVAHQELGDLDAAIVDLSEVLRLNAFSIKAYYKRASCYAARDDVQGAVADYTQAILRVPKDANAYLQRGIFLTKLQEYRTAVADFSSALSFNPKNADAYYHRGYCHAELGEKEKATQDFNQAMLYDPSQRVADYNRSYALGILKETKNLPPASSEMASPGAEQTVPEGNQSPAPSVIQEDEAIVLSLNAEDPTILTTDGPDLSPQSETSVEETLNVLDFEPGLEREVEEPDIIEALTSDEDVSVEPIQAQAPFPMPAPAAQEISVAALPEPVVAPADAPISGGLVRQSEVEALFAKAQHQVQLNHFEAAIALYSEIIEYEPQNARAYFERGRSFKAIDRGNEAAADVDTAVHLSRLKSLDLMKDYNNTLSETLADLRGGLEWENHPSSSLVHSQGNNQSIEGAILKYSQRIHRNPLDVHAYFERAKSRALLGDLEGAIADYTRTIALDDKYRDAYYRRGMLLSTLGDTDGATRDMNKAILRQPLLPAAAPKTPYVPMRSPSAASTSADTRDLTVREVVRQREMLENLDPSPQDDLEPPVISAPVRVPLVSRVSENQEGLEVDAEADVTDEIWEEKEDGAKDVTPTYFSDLVLEPCQHEGNDPSHRFCIHCGQPIPPSL